MTVRGDMTYKEWKNKQRDVNSVDGLKTAEKKPYNKQNEFTKSQKYGIIRAKEVNIERPESVEYRRYESIDKLTSTGDIAKYFSYRDEYGDAYSPIDVPSWEKIALPIQIESAHGIEYARQTFGLRSLPSKITFERVRNAYGEYNETRRIIRLNPSKLKTGVDAYSTTVHEMTHYADQLSGHASERTYRLARKDLSLKEKAREIEIRKIVGIYNAKDANNPSEIIAYATEKVAVGSQNPVAIKLFETFLKEASGK